MKEPWEIFADEYRRSYKAKGHNLASADAIAALAWHNANKKRDDDNRVIGEFYDVAARWHEEGEGDWAVLRESLRHQWTDFALRRRV